MDGASCRRCVCLVLHVLSIWLCAVCILTPRAQLPLLVNRRRLLERLQTIVGPSVEVDPDVTDFVQVGYLHQRLRAVDVEARAYTEFLRTLRMNSLLARCLTAACWYNCPAPCNILWRSLNLCRHGIGTAQRLTPRTSSRMSSGIGGWLVRRTRLTYRGSNLGIRQE